DDEARARPFAAPRDAGHARHLEKSPEELIERAAGHLAGPRLAKPGRRHRPDHFRDRDVHDGGARALDDVRERRLPEALAGGLLRERGLKRRRTDLEDGGAAERGGKRGRERQHPHTLSPVRLTHRSTSGKSLEPIGLAAVQRTAARLTFASRFPYRFVMRRTATAREKWCQTPFSAKLVSDTFFGRTPFWSAMPGITDR